MKKKIIISKLNNFEKIKDNNIFLGSWCFNNINNEEKYKTNTVNYPYNNLELKNRDYTYILELKDKLMFSFTETLNEYHNLNKDNNYWKILISTWLFDIISVCLDRWNVITELSKRFNTYDLKCDFISFEDKKFIANNNKIFVNNFCVNDAFNTYLYQEIILFFKENKLLNNLEISNYQKKNIIYPNNLDYIKKNLLRDIIFNIFEKLSFKKKHIIHDSGLSFINLTLLSFFLRQTPSYNIYLNDKVIKNSIKRKNLKFNFKYSNNFEKFLIKIIPKILPKSYLESFNAYRDYVLKIYTKPKTILTAISFYKNDVFKFYLAENKELYKSKIVIMDHGNSIPLHNSFFYNDYKLTDLRLKWSGFEDSNNKKIFPQKYLNYKINSKKKYITLFGLEHSKYLTTNIPGPISSNILEEFKRNFDFYNSLNQNEKKIFKIKPYINRGWNGVKEYENRFGKNKVINPNKKIKSVLKDTSYIICTYPQTNFLEAILTNLPTLLLISYKFWQFDKSFNDVIYKMKKNKILFFDAKEASNHINSLDLNYSEWWNETNVQSCRNDLLNELFGEKVDLSRYKNLNIMYNYIVK